MAGAVVAIVTSIAFAAAGAVAVDAATAAESAQTASPSLDLSTTEAINAYLASAGVDPATAVWQTGPLNYAGPNCPGAEWNCTTATTVVQLSQVGGANEFVCEPNGAQDPPTGGSALCVIAQAGPVNRAECRLESDVEPLAAQKCIIGQEGERNWATVRQLIVQDDGPTQDALQNADVNQNATEKNELHVYQTVRQSSSSGTTQNQDAHQVALVVQDVTGSVGNFSHVHQVQDQDLSGAATVQNQNTASLPTTTGDCAPVKAANPNQCANVDQQADSGSTNNSQLHQTIAERATSTVPSEVIQGRSDGGNEGRVHQEIAGTDTDGRNVNKAHATVTQRAFVPSDSPFPNQQTDPSCCGVGSQIGGENNVEHINLSTTQSSKPEGFQLAQLLGQSNTPTGGCSITLHGRNNADADAFTFSDPDGCVASFTMTCTSAPAGGDDVILAQESTGSCTDPDDPPVIDATQTFTILATSPTFGLDIPMPSFDEPDDYVTP